MDAGVDDELDYFGQFVDLAAFLDESSRVEMVRRHEPNTVDELIACATEGGLDDAWTENFFSKDRIEKFLQLEQSLAKESKPETYFAIIRLLLLCYSREQVVPIVDSFVDSVDDQDLKEQAMFLMLVFDE